MILLVDAVGIEPTTCRLREELSTYYQRLTRNGWLPNVLKRNNEEHLIGRFLIDDLNVDDSNQSQFGRMISPIAPPLRPDVL
jgi:hypothetical protein